MTINVVKRNGHSTPLNLEKVHQMVEHACRDLAGVSESQVEMNANLQFFDGIETKDIQEILIKSANDLISLDAPNYQFVAARLLLFSLRKSVYKAHPDSHPTLKTQVDKGIVLGVYDKTLAGAYSDDEWDENDSNAGVGVHPRDWAKPPLDKRDGSESEVLSTHTSADPMSLIREIPGAA